MAKYKIFNSAIGPTVARAGVTTGTALKTMLQVKVNPLISRMKILEWGVSCDGAAVAAGIKWELMTSGLIAATVTASVEADISFWPTKTSELVTPVLAADRFTLGVAATGYTASAEGTIVAGKTLDAVVLTPTLSFTRVFDKPPLFNNTDFLRVRCIAAAAVNAVVWVILEG